MSQAREKISVALLCDSPDEGWHSMDIVAQMLKSELEKHQSEVLSVQSIAKPIRKILRGFPFAGANPKAFSADRFLHRYWQYPQYARKISKHFDVLHIVDHSYSALALGIPPQRTVITCHDIDAFSSICGKESQRRSVAFQFMTRVLLQGFRRAARVICVSETTRRSLIEADLVDADRTVVIHNGVDPIFSPNADPSADREAETLLGTNRNQHVDILNVGSTVPRKRIDTLLKVIANLKDKIPTLRLIRVGGQLTQPQSDLARSLGVADLIISLPFVEARTLAAIYRRTALTIQPSEAEGFGLPIIEAMACGTTVIASDIPCHREIGGGTAHYCSLEDIDAWSADILRFLTGSNKLQMKAENILQAALFSWRANAIATAAVYQEIASNLAAPNAAENRLADPGAAEESHASGSGLSTLITAL